MRKLALVMVFMAALVITAFSAVGCSEKKAPTQDTVSTDTMVVTRDTVVVDSAETLIAETPMPKAADELFDDFIFNFAANKRLQFRRIQFPLHEYHEGQLAHTYTRKQWQMEHFFMRQDYYTLILDNMRQMEAGKDTAVNHVVIEKIYLDEDYVRQFVFNRVKGEWMMTSIKQESLEANANGDFLRFYHSFATDSLFQQEHLHNPVSFSGPDPDDDFGTMTGEIAPETWPAFAPQLPAGMIYNIIYGKHQPANREKVFVMRGIANGLEMWLTFKHDGERWVLTKLNT